MMAIANLWIYAYLLIVMISQPLPAMMTGKNAVSFNSSLPLPQSAQNFGGNKYQQMLCSESKYDCSKLVCSKTGPTLQYGHCVTYSEDTNLLSMSTCRYFESESYNVTGSQSILLPINLSRLNDYMCGPLNRKGLVCSECADGFGPSATSFKHKCVNCTGAWYSRVPLFLLLEFAPITILYLTVLVFRISVTSPPVPCFIMYAQFVVIAFDSNNYLSFIDSGEITIDLKILLTVYGLFNLDFCRYDLLPPICVSNKLKPIHSFFLGYISACYPIVLICLTWLCVELHDRNFRPLVWLWKPFHRCFVRLRRGWNTKTDIIDVFTTFFFLSYTKIIYQTLLLLNSQIVKQCPVSKLGTYSSTYHPVIDLGLEYGDSYHLSFAIPTVVISSILYFLPPLLLILYPVKIFRSCLSKCHLNFIAVHIFIDKVQSCYRNGLDGGRDMRSFSGIYFFLRGAVYLLSSVSHALQSYIFICDWFTLGTLFFLASLTVAIAKPYCRAYMNYWDIAILSHLAITCYSLSSGAHALLLDRILLTVPITVFFIITMLTKCCVMSKVCYNDLKVPKYCSCFTSGNTLFTAEPCQSCRVDYPTVSQPLIQPTSTVISYGTCMNS